MAPDKKMVLVGEIELDVNAIYDDAMKLLMRCLEGNDELIPSEFPEEERRYLDDLRELVVDGELTQRHLMAIAWFFVKFAEIAKDKVIGEAVADAEEHVKKHGHPPGKIITPGTGTKQ